MNIYFETSAADYMTKILRGMDAFATYRFQEQKGNKWSISTTVLWEMMLIKDFKDYDAALYMISTLFNKVLLKSAAEVVIDYINGVSFSNSYCLETNSSIRKAWKRACDDKSFSFNIIGSNLVNITEEVKKCSKYMPSICDFNDTENDEITNDYALMSKDMINYYYKKTFTDEAPKMIQQLRKISMFVLFFNICCCLDITSDKIDEFWERENKKDIIQRFEYILQKYTNVISHGPLWNIANAIYTQCLDTRKSGRGIMLDGLHSVYLPFVDIFITADEHFKILRDSVTQEYREKLYHKIFHISELKLVEYPVE
jgi:hypothetical protein